MNKDIEARKIYDLIKQYDYWDQIELLEHVKNLSDKYRIQKLDELKSQIELLSRRPNSKVLENA